MAFDRKKANFILRVVLGLILFIPGTMKILAYFNVIEYALPPINKIIPFLPLNTLGLLLGIVELIIGVLLIIGFYTRFAAWSAAVLFAVFILSGVYLGLFMKAGLFKDVGLFAGALMLATEGCRLWGLDCRSLKRMG